MNLVWYLITYIETGLARAMLGEAVSSAGNCYRRIYFRYSLAINFSVTQSAFTNSKLTLETPEQDVKYVPS